MPEYNVNELDVHIGANTFNVLTPNIIVIIQWFIFVSPTHWKCIRIQEGWHKSNSNVLVMWQDKDGQVKMQRCC